MRSSSLSFWTLLRHRLKAYWRTPFLGRRVASLIVGGMIALYLGGALAVAGVFFDDMIHAVAPSADPLLLASRGLLPFGLGYAVLQLFLTSGLGVDPTPYRTLPIRRQTLTLLLTVFALASAWVAIPLVFVGAVCIETALSGAMGTALRFGLACAGLLVTVTYAVPIGQRALSNYPLYAVGALSLGVGTLAVEAVPIPLVSLLDVSGWLFGGIMQSRLLPSVVGLLVLGSAVAGYQRSLRRALDVDRSGKNEWSVGANNLLDRLAQKGPAYREAVLMARLHLRNSQLRLGLLMLPLFVGILIFAGYMMEALKPLDIHMLNLCVFGTGFHILFSATNLFCFEGRYLEAIAARPASSGQRMRGRYLFVFVLSLFLFIAPLPFLLWWQSPFFFYHLAFSLYNVGVAAPLALAASTFNRTVATINEWQFVGENDIQTGRTISVLPIFGGLALPFLLSDPIWQLILLGSLGLFSAFATPLWLRGLTTLYDWNRHAMLEGFQASRDEH